MGRGDDRPAGQGLRVVRHDPRRDPADRQELHGLLRLVLRGTLCPWVPSPSAVTSTRSTCPGSTPSIAARPRASVVASSLARRPAGQASGEGRTVAPATGLPSTPRTRTGVLDGGPRARRIGPRSSFGRSRGETMATVVPGDVGPEGQGPGPVAAADRDVDREPALGVRLDLRQLHDVDIEVARTS